KELTARDLWQLFQREYGLATATAPTQMSSTELAGGSVRVNAELDWNGERLPVQGEGNGPIDAFVNALTEATGRAVRVLDYHEHALGPRAQGRATAYMELRVDARHTVFGVGSDTNSVSASFKAIVPGLRRVAPEQVQHNSDSVAL